MPLSQNEDNAAVWLVSWQLGRCAVWKSKQQWRGSCNTLQHCRQRALEARWSFATWMHESFLWWLHWSFKTCFLQRYPCFLKEISKSVDSCVIGARSGSCSSQLVMLASEREASVLSRVSIPWGSEPGWLVCTRRTWCQSAFGFGDAWREKGGGQAVSYILYVVIFLMLVFLSLCLRIL